MPDYADARHRPYSTHYGEPFVTPIARGPEALNVTLDAWTEHPDLFTGIYDALQANWGERPSRTVQQRCTFVGTAQELFEHERGWEHKNGWCKLLLDQRSYVEACFAGKTLQQVLEGITFYFSVDGCSRAFTHQYVRTRLGAGFMQHGGRDNDWRQRGWTMPETIARTCDAADIKHREELEGDLPHPGYPGEINGRIVPVKDWGPIEALLKGEAEAHQLDDVPRLRDVISNYLDTGKELYSALVDAGIPWQDARRLLWMGTQTYIHAEYNYVGLKGVLANRLEYIMDWEINCVCQLMLRQITMKCPPLFARYLGSHSDVKKLAAFAKLESWPADGKWPVPEDAKGLDRQHSAEQMPFFVLHPDSMAGGEIRWLWTNGHYGDAAKQLKDAQLKEAYGGSEEVAR